MEGKYGGEDNTDKEDNNYSSSNDSGYADEPTRDGHNSARSSDSGLTAIPE